MRQLRAMMKKELFEQLKTHRLVVMLLLFTLVGVLSPAFAKMTPWLLDLVSGDMAETGIQIGNLEVTSLSSWTQYYKNMQIILFVFLILYGGILTSEYQHGTLIILLSKGLKRQHPAAEILCPASDLDIWVSDQLWHHLCLHRLLLGQQHHSEPGVLPACLLSSGSVDDLCPRRGFGLLPVSFGSSSGLCCLLRDLLLCRVFPGRERLCSNPSSWTNGSSDRNY